MGMKGAGKVRGEVQGSRVKAQGNTGGAEFPPVAARRGGVAGLPQGPRRAPARAVGRDSVSGPRVC